MVSITSPLPNYAPPLSVPAATPDASNSNSNSASPRDSSDIQSSDTSDLSGVAPATNAVDNAPAIYTALASEATSTIRGTNVNTSV